MDLKSIVLDNIVYQPLNGVGELWAVESVYNGQQLVQLNLVEFPLIQNLSVKF